MNAFTSFVREGPVQWLKELAKVEVVEKEEDFSEDSSKEEQESGNGRMKDSGGEEGKKENGQKPKTYRVGWLLCFLLFLALAPLVVFASHFVSYGTLQYLGTSNNYQECISGQVIRLLSDKELQVCTSSGDKEGADTDKNTDTDKDDVDTEASKASNAESNNSPETQGGESKSSSKASNAEPETSSESPPDTDTDTSAANNSAEAQKRPGRFDCDDLERPNPVNSQLEPEQLEKLLALCRDTTIKNHLHWAKHYGCEKLFDELPKVCTSTKEETPESDQAPEFDPSSPGESQDPQNGNKQEKPRSLFVQIAVDVSDSLKPNADPSKETILGWLLGQPNAEEPRILGKDDCVRVIAFGSRARVILHKRLLSENEKPSFDDIKGNLNDEAGGLRKNTDFVDLFEKLGRSWGLHCTERSPDAEEKSIPEYNTLTFVLSDFEHDPYEEDNDIAKQFAGLPGELDTHTSAQEIQQFSMTTAIVFPSKAKDPNEPAIERVDRLLTELNKVPGVEVLHHDSITKDVLKKLVDEKRKHYKVAVSIDGSGEKCSRPLERDELCLILNGVPYENARIAFTVVSHNAKSMDDGITGAFEPGKDWAIIKRPVVDGAEPRYLKIRLLLDERFASDPGKALHLTAPIPPNPQRSPVESDLARSPQLRYIHPGIQQALWTRFDNRSNSGVCVFLRETRATRGLEMDPVWLDVGGKWETERLKLKLVGSRWSHAGPFAETVPLDLSWTSAERICNPKRPLDRPVAFTDHEKQPELSFIVPDPGRSRIYTLLMAIGAGRFFCMMGYLIAGWMLLFFCSCDRQVGLLIRAFRENRSEYPDQLGQQRLREDTSRVYLADVKCLQRPLEAMQLALVVIVLLAFGFYAPYEYLGANEPGVMTAVNRLFLAVGLSLAIVELVRYTLMVSTLEREQSLMMTMHQLKDPEERRKTLKTPFNIRTRSEQISLSLQDTHSRLSLSLASAAVVMLLEIYALPLSL